MFKRILLSLGIGLGGWLFLSFGAPMGFVAQVVELPTELAGALAGAIFFVVSLVLSGRIPNEYIEEIAGAITTALVTILSVLLRLVPVEFEPLATAILGILVIILGMIGAVKLLFAGGQRLVARLTK
jgi:hypothetical protein